MTRQSWILFVRAVALATISLGGCAQVTVRKVPSATHYAHWTDAQQRNADEIPGIRFYLPRPFLNVFESFPVRTDIYLASGVVSPDGKYILITSVKGDSGLAKYISSPNGTAELPVSTIQIPASSPAGNTSKVDNAAQSGGQSGESNSAGENAKVPIGTTVTSGAAAPSAPTVSTGVVQNQTGNNTFGSINDNSAFAFQPLRGNFDLVYLPDFDEQYAVSSEAGLGNAKFSLNLGQGWSMQGMNATEDNSALNSRIFDLIDTSMKLAKAAANAALDSSGLPGISTQLSVAQSGSQPGTGPQTSESLPPATPVSLKIVVVHYAAKGLYPVLKPSELQQRTVSQKTMDLGIMNLFVSNPPVEYATDIDPTALASAAQAVDSETGDFTVPRYPYQYVSFNTFRYMAVQLIRTTDSPFGELYDKTGTKGDPGDRQASTDLKSGTSPPVTSTPANSATTTTDPKQFLKDNSNAIIAALGSAPTGNTFVSNGVSFTIKPSPVIDSATQTLTVELDTKGDANKAYVETSVESDLLIHVNKIITAMQNPKGKAPTNAILSAVVSNSADVLKLFKQP